MKQRPPTAGVDHFMNFMANLSLRVTLVYFSAMKWIFCSFFLDAGNDSWLQIKPLTQFVHQVLPILSQFHPKLLAGSCEVVDDVPLSIVQNAM